MDIKKLIHAEIAVINRTLSEFSVNAGVQPDGSGTLVAQSSHITHRIDKGTGVQISDVEKRLPELRHALSVFRGTDNLPVRLQTPALVLETPHPAPKVLEWKPELLKVTKPHSMLIGRHYTSDRKAIDEWATFEDCSHALVAGITKAGKSVLMQMMLLSLCYATSPKHLRIVLVDLKNEDMLPFADLPHVVTFAKRPEEALAAIQSVVDEKERRIDNPNRKPYRLILWIDELLQLAQEKAALEMLGDLASIGRSKAINLIAATQHPTEKGGLGTIMKANFPLRLVGMVAPGMAHIATGRPKTGAEQLPGKGAFLYCQSNDVHRFQSYHIAPADVERVAQAVKAKWAGETVKPLQTAKPVRDRVSVFQAETGGLSETGGLNRFKTGQRFTEVENKPFVIDVPYAMPDSSQVRNVIRRIYKAAGSKNKAIDILWPGRNKVTCLQYLNYAIGD